MAVEALSVPLVNKSLDEIMKARPELDGGAEVRIIVPTKCKKGLKK